MQNLVFLAVCFLLFLLPTASCNLATAIGSLSPTGGIGIENNKYTLYIEMELFDDYPLEAAFTPEIYITIGNLFEGRRVPLDGVLVVEGDTTKTYENVLYGYDSSSYSVVFADGTIGITKGIKVKITINNINYKDNGALKSVVAYAALGQSTDNTLERRVQIPFHPFSFVATNKTSGALVTRFTSSFGFLTTAHVSFEYPSCVTLQPTTGFVDCYTLSWLTIESSLGRNVLCEVQGQVFTMKDIGMSYPTSKQNTIRFGIGGQSGSQCGKNDHVKVTVFSSGNGRETERATLFGLSENSIDESVMAEREARYDGGFGSYSAGLMGNFGVTVAILCLMALAFV